MPFFLVLPSTSFLCVVGDHRNAALSLFQPRSSVLDPREPDALAHAPFAQFRSTFRETLSIPMHTIPPFPSPPLGSRSDVHALARGLPPRLATIRWTCRVGVNRTIFLSGLSGERDRE